MTSKSFSFKVRGCLRVRAFRASRPLHHRFPTLTVCLTIKASQSGVSASCGLLVCVSWLVIRNSSVHAAAISLVQDIESNSVTSMLCPWHSLALFTKSGCRLTITICIQCMVKNVCSRVLVLKFGLAAYTVRDQAFQWHAGGNGGKHDYIFAYIHLHILA